MFSKIRESESLTGYLMVFTAGVLWGFIGLFVKLLSGLGADASVIAFLRLFTAFLIMIPVLFFMSCKENKNLFKIDLRGLLKCALLGILTQAIYNYCYNRCIGSVGVATASILLYTAPVFVFIFSRILFKEKIGSVKILSLILNMTGCFLVVSGGSLENPKLSLFGVVMGLMSAFLYSMVTIIGKVTTAGANPFTVVFYSFLFGAISLAIISRPWEIISEIANMRFWMYSFGFGLIPSVGSYIFYFGGIKKNIELSKASIFASVEPVVATLIGVILFKEVMGIVNVVGIISLVCSIILLNKKSKEA